MFMYTCNYLHNTILNIGYGCAFLDKDKTGLYKRSSFALLLLGNFTVPKNSFSLKILQLKKIRLVVLMDVSLKKLG